MRMHMYIPECLHWVAHAVFTASIKRIHRSPRVLYYLPHYADYNLASHRFTIDAAQAPSKAGLKLKERLD